MTKWFNAKSKKDKFAVEQVIPYLLDRIGQNDDQRVIDSAAAMCVYPYKVEGGTLLGPLKEPGISWYYLNDEKSDLSSSKAYRVLDKSVLTEDVARRLIEKFGRLNLISEHNNAVVINSLIDQMSREEDYTPRWWDLALAVFDLWNPDESRINLIDATGNIKPNDAFLFLVDYCSDELKDRLVKAKVFSDVKTPTAREHFWSRVGYGGRQKANKMLAAMGVPSSFVVGDEVNHRILSLALRVGNEIDFSKELAKSELELCDLAYELFFDRIVKESPDALIVTVENYEEDYAQGIPVRNVRGEYVPLSFDLFCQKDRRAQEQAEEDDEARHPLQGSAYERLRVGEEYYKTGLSNIHAFEEVHDPFEKYHLGSVGEKKGSTEFYQWVWSYSQHDALARIILGNYSVEGFGGRAIPNEAVVFVLDVLSSLGGRHPNYCFDIKLSCAKSFGQVDKLNDITERFANVHLLSSDRLTEVDVYHLMANALSVVEIDRSVKNEVHADPLWEHVCLAPANVGVTYPQRFLLAHKKEGGAYSRCLVLSAVDEYSLQMAVANYIDDTYGTDTASHLAVEVDWGEEYNALISDIKKFLEETSEHRDKTYVYGIEAALDDVRNFGTEKDIWLKMREERSTLFATKSDRNPIDLEKSRVDLSHTYGGRCQLCGDRTATDDQKGYFWTYRMVKSRDNKLANMMSNIFCLCPSCHGRLQYGSYFGKNLNEIVDQSRKYAAHLDAVIRSGEYEDDFPSVVSEVYLNQCEERGVEQQGVEGFYKPLLFKVMVNGEDKYMAFSWRHFMRVAFVFSSINALQSL